MLLHQQLGTDLQCSHAAAVSTAVGGFCTQGFWAFGCKMHLDQVLAKAIQLRLRQQEGHKQGGGVLQLAGHETGGPPQTSLPSALLATPCPEQRWLQPWHLAVQPEE